MGKKLGFLIMAVILLGTGGISYAMCGSCPSGAHSEAHGRAEARGPEPVDNKICPVRGEAIDEGSKATFEYKGKIYNFCCEACIEPFKKDPKKYIRNMENMETAKTGDAHHH